MLSFGTQEFFDTLKSALNGDEKFRELGKGTYNATELIVIRDLGIGIWQQTVDGEVLSFTLIKRSEVKSLESTAELVYYVDSYDAPLIVLYLHSSLDGDISPLQFCDEE